MEEFIESRSKNLTLVKEWFAKQRGDIEEEDVINFSEDIENSDERIEVASEMSDEKISEKNSDNNNEKKKKFEKKEEETATLIGLVSEVRHIPTKTGGMMIIATVQSIGFDFTVVVFNRDFSIYENKLIEDFIVSVEGKLRFDEER